MNGEKSILPVCEVYWLGMMDYQDTLRLQNQLATEIAAGQRGPTLLLLEHPHTFTFGRLGHAENLLWDDEECRRNGVSVHWVDRGGDVSYLGPGLLVGYPVLKLPRVSDPGSEQPFIDIIGYVRRLEQLLMISLAELGIPSGQRRGLTGVWVPADVRARCLRCDPAQAPDPAKIASIGLKVDVHGVTRHGFALNVNPEMSYWQGIVPCGIQGVTMTCLAELMSEPPTVLQAAERIVDAFGRVFNMEMTWIRQPEEIWPVVGSDPAATGA